MATTHTGTDLRQDIEPRPGRAARASPSNAHSGAAVAAWLPEGRQGRGGRRNTRGRSMAKQKCVVRAELTGRWGWVAERWAEEERQKWRERSAWRQSPQAGQ